mgnify:CR=1 FL=1
MRLISLQSGSSGNCIYVESNDVRLLFDAGLSASQVDHRLAAHEIDPKTIDALFISHNHSDHVRCANMYLKKFGFPLFATEPTLYAAKRSVIFERGADIHHFRSGTSTKIKHVTIETICTPHDAVDGVVFVIDDGQHRLGICTDVGHVFQDLKSLVKGVDGLFLESNYDEEMLENGSYPYFLKKRISGPGGHISNREAANLVAKNATARLQWLCLAHLSASNNSPEKALAAHRRVLSKDLPIQVTNRFKPSEALTLGTKQTIVSQMVFDF